MILLIDNYDSFVHNLARYFRRLGQETCIVRNDAITADKVRRLSPRAIVISPGPCTPDEAGSSVDIVREFYQQLPILGVCLGHQTIAAAFDANIMRANEPMHGRISAVDHHCTALFAGLPSPLTVCRYHSLIVEEKSLPDELEVTARTADGTIMAIQHKKHPLFGVQFHPEATLTQHGFQLLANFLQLAGIATDFDAGPIAASEFCHASTIEVELPSHPITF
jgi:anthranilate synthase/aminodeoxychorismate synthase-like glutamine amidotransferase